MKTRLGRLTALAAVLYLAAVAVLYFSQDKLLFPAPQSYPQVTPSGSFEDLRIPVNVSGHLHAWWIPAAAPTDKVILVFHGNGYVIEEMASGEAPLLLEIGANLLLVDYRGYGSSSPVSPNETTVDEDAGAALNYLLNVRKVAMANVFVLGRSIGSGAAAYLAVNRAGLGGLILETPFSSIEDAASGVGFFRIFPLRLMLRTRFDNLSRIGAVRCPVLIVAGSADTLTPSWMAGKIFARAREPKQLYIVPGAGHNDLPEVGGQALTRVLRRFIGI